MTAIKNITTIILTLNEEQDLPRCLAALDWCKSIIVVDAGSSDRTVDIATAHGCVVYERNWPGFAAQRNWALQHTNVKTDWVLFIDADEVVTKELVAEIENAITSNMAAFYITFKVMLWDKWVRRSSNFPVWHPRLCRLGHVVYKNAVTGHGETWDVHGEVGYLKSPYLHYNFSKGFSSWLAKHNRLSSMECDAFFEHDYRWTKNIALLFGRDKHKKRQALRQLSFRFPLRPLLRFTYNYIFKGGFLEGRAGFIYCSLYFIYEVMIQVKISERKMRGKKEAVH